MKKEEKVQKTNKSLIALCVILVLIVISLVGVLCYLLGSENTKRAESSYEVKEEKEAEIKDIDALTELSTTIDMLLSNEKAVEYNISKIYSLYGFRFGVLKNKLTNDNKQEIVLNTISWDKITGDNWKQNKTMTSMNQNMLADQPDTNWFIENSHQLTVDKVNAHSIDLFGEKITNPKETTGKCPIYVFDSEQKMYFMPAPQCGGAAAGIIHSYKSKFIQNKNNAYVYVSFAYLIPNEENYNQTVAYKDFTANDDALYFGNIDYKDEYKTNNYISESTNLITEDNYKEFSEYKFIFEQASNGNYYFVDIEQTK